MANQLKTQCCIAGGGPAGMMLGFLLARAGIEVVVLEKHADFFRDFRGDTIHPSTFQLMHELGLLDEFLKVPHQEVKHLEVVFNGESIQLADFTHLNVAKPVLGLMPQWDFLKFLQTHAAKHPTFKLILEAEVTDIIKEKGRITGVTATTKDGTLDVFGDIVVATDGRGSVLRKKAGLKVVASGVPIDVLWFRVSRQPDDPAQTFGRFDHGRIMVLLNRDEYWQCAYLIEKGTYPQVQQKGLPVFYKELSGVSPFLANRMPELKSWDGIKLLSVDIDHLETWYTDGLLCIGDAAHAMSPIGGVGINLAVQDAVATANILYEPLSRRKVITTDILQKVQDRRTFPTKVIQRVQIFIQNGIMSRRSAISKSEKPPLPFRLIKAFPLLSRIPAWIVGIGVRPEHVKTPEANQSKN